MRHVLWIGGAPAAGKTAIATWLARRHGLRWYGSDTRTWQHRDRALARGVPAALRFEALPPQERWATTTPEEKVELSLHRERGPMVLDDLRALSSSPLVVAEGTTLPAAAIQDMSRAVWLIPTPEFQQARFDERDLSPGVRELYLLLTHAIEREAREHGVPVHVVDDTATVEVSVAAIERRFRQALAEGPVASTRTERRALLREANEAVVAQVRGYCARPWADQAPDEVVRTLLCECGDPGCDATVETRVGAAAAAPVLAAAHCLHGEGR